MKYFIQIFILAAFITGCKEDNSSNAEAEFSKIIDLSLREDLTNELGTYTGQFQPHNGNVNVRTTIRDNISNEISYSGRITAWNLENISSAHPTNVDGGDYFINNVHLRYDGTSYVADQFIGENSLKDFNLINGFIQNEVLGKEVTIKNIQNGEEIFNEKFYVPKEFLLTGIGEKIPETNFVEMKRNNFMFTYNQDIKNENGLLVRLEYNGEIHGMSLADFENIDPNDRKSRVVHIKGESSKNTTLPSELFEGIPSNGIVTIYFGRGNGKMFNLDDKSYYIRCFNTQQIRVVLD